MACEITKNNNNINIVVYSTSSLACTYNTLYVVHARTYLIYRIYIYGPTDGGRRDPLCPSLALCWASAHAHERAATALSLVVVTARATVVRCVNPVRARVCVYQR